MPNRLAHETSPYLLQHADNPVDWYPWSEAALARARDESKPILLSIGYAACHWCHVMAHESFEDEKTAAYMNEHFVNIKVDREERPDLDGIYMQAVVAMTRSGGWPMTVFLTPEGEPFFGGTYFPPEPRYGMPSFAQVLVSVSQAWDTRREEIVTGAREIAAHLQQDLKLQGDPGALGPSLFENAMETLRANYDDAYGGFGSAPKFPQPMTIEFLLQEHLRSGDQEARRMAVETLEQMARGGMYDQVGGGFARYSTDARWLVPHFEKMLYDNGLLARVYLHAYQLTGRPLFRRTTEEILDYVVREMRHEAGGFYSSQDADSEGEEGKFYVWQAEEVRKLLEEDADLIMRYFGISEQGNWEGKNILHVPGAPSDVAHQLEMDLEEAEERVQRGRQALYEARAQRVWPGLDDKVLTAWNGLMLAAFAEAGKVLGREDYLAIATENANFLHETMRGRDGRLWRTWKDGAAAKYNGYLEDYAYLADGLLALYQATFAEQWFVWAKELADLMLAHFHDEANGGFFDTSDDHEALIQRPKDVQDNAVPSGNAMAASCLARLALLTGESHYWQVAETAVAGMSRAMGQYPTGFAQWLTTAAFLTAEPEEVALVGNPGAGAMSALLAALREPYRPHLVVALREPEAQTVVPLLKDRIQVDGKPTAYVCRQFVCRLPVTTPEALLEQLS